MLYAVVVCWSTNSDVRNREYTYWLRLTVTVGDVTSNTGFIVSADEKGLTSLLFTRI